MSKQKARRLGTVAFFSFVILLLFTLFYLVREKSKYSDVFFEQTVINGLDCSLLTVDEAVEVIQNEVEQYSLDVVFKDNNVETISGSEIDFTIYNLKAKLLQIKEHQYKNWYFKGTSYILNDYVYNEAKLKDLLLDKQQFQKDYMDKNTDISYVFSSSSKCFEVREQNSYYLDFDEVFEVISTSVKSQKSRVSLENLYLDVDVSSDLEQMNSLITAEITYELPNGTSYVLDANTLHKWLKKDKSGKYFKDDSLWNNKLKHFVRKSLVPLCNTKNIPKEFMPTGKDYTVFVEGGDYGYEVDVNAEIKKLQQELENGTVISRIPCYQQTAVSSKNYGFGDSYVEIDLTRQTVWVYLNGNLKLETACVTGCINKGHGTPTGVFTLTYKEKDRILRGAKLPDGSYSYASHVDYWMPFNGGIGLHDASWRNSFGGDIYISNGSHGCINLPLSAAEELYSILDYNMPIIVYES